MVEMHLLAVNVDFRYDPIYALGVVTTFDRFMQGYRPENDKVSIFNALCQALESDPQQYRRDAEHLLSLASQHSWETLLIPDAVIGLPEADGLRDRLQAIRSAHAAQDRFKYSRLFAVGLFTMLETANPDVVKDEAKLVDALKKVCQALNLSEDKVQKDLELYRSNLEKMNQVQAVMADALAADRKKRAERAAAQAATDESNAEAPKS